MPKVTQKQLLDFAHLSKDFNPVHLDEVFAKQSYFGEQILYGIYQVFYVLESHFKKYPMHHICSLKAIFVSPIGVKNYFSLKQHTPLNFTSIQKLDSKNTPEVLNPNPESTKKISHNLIGGGGGTVFLPLRYLRQRRNHE